jgi:hypothetical protein
MISQKEMIDLLRRHAWLVNAVNTYTDTYIPTDDWVDEIHRIETRFAGALGLVE